MDKFVKELVVTTGALCRNRKNDVRYSYHAGHLSGMCDLAFCFGKISKKKARELYVEAIKLSEKERNTWTIEDTREAISTFCRILEESEGAKNA